MRRENRRKNSQSKITTDKIILYAGIGVAILAVVVFGLFIYSKSLSDDVKNSTMSLEQMANMANNNTQNTESASTDIGKSVEESTNELKETNTTNSINTTNVTNNQTKNNTANTFNTNKTNNTMNVTTNSDVIKTETKKELSFERPVEGEMAREYAKDNLIYSATLEEWTTHMGIDIKADKTTVVKASEAGKLTGIKNDPRYGNTLIIEHTNGFETRYANLLTAEFINVGETVTKGQTIGTVGNTATFEPGGVMGRV